MCIRDSDDTASPRRIRGRKFYWRTQPQKGLAERWRARDHHFEEEPPRKPKEIIEQVQIIHKNSTFEFRVSFENLRQQQIGSLLAAIDPGKVLTAKDAAHPIVTSVGGGRPFGWQTRDRRRDPVVRRQAGRLEPRAAEAGGGGGRAGVARPRRETPEVHAVVDDGMPVHAWHECRTDNNKSAEVSARCAGPK